MQDDLLPHDIAHAELIAARVAALLQEQVPVVPEYLDAYEAAVFLGVTTKTLEARRFKGTGPRYTKHGARMVRYNVNDLRAWMEVGHVAS